MQEDGEALMALFAAEQPRVVVNLAAQAGVRYSLENPAAYIQSNLVGSGHILEDCRHHGVENLVYASSSSVYGGNRNLPFHERQPVNHPVSLYAASKKANELDGSHLQPFVWPACNRTAFFYRVWPLGPARYGADAVRQGDPRR